MKSRPGRSKRKIILLNIRVCDKIQSAHALMFFKTDKNLKDSLLGGENYGR